MEVKNNLYSEREIIEKLKIKDNLNDSLKILYKNYYGLLEKYVLNNSGTKEDAQDVIQDTMVAFVNLIQQDKFREESGLGTFLYAIARNIWLGKIRKQKAEINHNDQFLNNQSQIDQDVTYQLEKQESLNFVVKLFESLGTVCHKILTLFYFEEMPMKDIILQVNFENEQVLRNKKSKCMKALTDKIEINPELAENLKKTLHNLKWKP